MRELITTMLNGNGGGIPRIAKVKVYPYRTASIAVPPLCKFPRKDMRDIEEMLAKAAGVHPDNHTVYAVSNNGGTIYLKFSDSNVYMGLVLLEQSSLM